MTTAVHRHGPDHRRGRRLHRVHGDRRRQQRPADRHTGDQSPIDEGSSSELHFNDQFDPSTADTTAGFHYSFACTSSIGDLPARTPRGRHEHVQLPVRRQRHLHASTAGSSTRTTASRAHDGSVTVNNVAPTATLTNDGPINEGSRRRSASPARPTRALATQRPASTTPSAATTATCPAPPTPLQHLRHRRPARSPTTAPTRQGPDHRQGRRLHRVHGNCCRQQRTAGDHGRRLSERERGQFSHGVRHLDRSGHTRHPRGDD